MTPVNLNIDPGWSCAQIIHRFFFCLDEGTVVKGAALFLEDSVWTKRGMAIKGRAAILASMLERPSHVKTRHLVTNMITDADPQGCVTASYYVTTFADEAWQSGVSPIELPALILVCEDRLTETADGWRFISRSSRTAFSKVAAGM